jgi:tetratricopeptide (TPR) repeat protein
VYDYSTPFVEYVSVAAESAPAAPANQTVVVEQYPPGVTTQGLTAFDAARDAFYQGNYSQALQQIDQAIKQMPNDAIAHQFRALALFALGKYKEAAAAIYLVTSAGPGWNWTTMSSLYGVAGDYEKQLRALEDYVRSNPKAAEGHFLLGYHYLTCGHANNAADQFRQVQAINPDDPLTKNLLAMLEPAKETAPQTPPAAGGDAKPAREPVKTIPAASVAGTWTASAKGAQFTMTLTTDGKFTWAYSRGSKREEVKGVFAMEENVIAMEPSNAAPMLAEITLGTDGKMKFQAIGAPKGDPGLEFVKNKS